MGNLHILYILTHILICSVKYLEKVLNLLLLLWSRYPDKGGARL